MFSYSGVYALVDPVYKVVCYVGSSNNIWRRYGQHISEGARTIGHIKQDWLHYPKENWIGYLLEHRLMPVLEMLQSLDRHEYTRVTNFSTELFISEQFKKDVEDLEVQYIERYMLEDKPLLNVDPYYKSVLARYPEKLEEWKSIRQQFLQPMIEADKQTDLVRRRVHKSLRKLK